MPDFSAKRMDPHCALVVVVTKANRVLVVVPLRHPHAIADVMDLRRGTTHDAAYLNNSFEPFPILFCRWFAHAARLLYSWHRVALRARWPSLT